MDGLRSNLKSISLIHPAAFDKIFLISFFLSSSSTLYKIAFLQKSIFNEVALEKRNDLIHKKKKNTNKSRFAWDKRMSMEMAEDKENQENKKKILKVSLYLNILLFLNLQTLIASSIKRCGDLHV